MESSSLRRVLVMFLAFAAVVPIVPAAHAGIAREDGSCRSHLVSGVAAPPVGIGGCGGVRPGAYVDAPQGGCTLNFVFDAREQTADGTRTVRYIGTAGHCALGSEGEASWARNDGPKAFDANGRKIGEFVYAILRPGDGLIGAHRDFALIRLDADVDSRARLCHFGGPTGVNADTHGDPVVVHYYGQGLGVGETVPARTALVRSLRDPDIAGATGAINYGDSGAGVISDDGRALGVIVQFVDESGPDVVGITRIRPQKQRAEAVLNVNLSLITAPLN